MAAGVHQVEVGEFPNAVLRALMEAAEAMLEQVERDVLVPMAITLVMATVGAESVRSVFVPVMVMVMVMKVAG